jgi:hypothetical protein
MSACYSRRFAVADARGFKIGTVTLANQDSGLKETHLRAGPGKGDGFRAATDDSP